MRPTTPRILTHFMSLHARNRGNLSVEWRHRCTPMRKRTQMARTAHGHPLERILQRVRHRGTPGSAGWGAIDEGGCAPPFLHPARRTRQNDVTSPSAACAWGQHGVPGDGLGARGPGGRMGGARKTAASWGPRPPRRHARPPAPKPTPQGCSLGRGRARRGGGRGQPPPPRARAVRTG